MYMLYSLLCTCFTRTETKGCVLQMVGDGKKIFHNSNMELRVCLMKKMRFIHSKIRVLQIT